MDAETGGRHRRRTSRAIQENDMLQMSVSELNANGSVAELSADPLGDSSDDKNIYGLGVLSPSNLEKQPSSTSPAEPKEVVKVQFIQSGGKVVPVKSPCDASQPTPRKAKKKLSTLLGGFKSSSKNKKSPLSKYQTVSDDDGGMALDEDSGSAMTDLSSWKQVDAAIPVLQL